MFTEKVDTTGISARGKSHLLGTFKEIIS